MGLGWPELTVIAVIIIALFGWKRLPDMARSVGRSARIFKSEVDEMKKDGQSSEASTTTVPGSVVDPTQDRVTDAATDQATDTVAQAEARLAEARLAEAEAKAAAARAEAERLRGDSTL